MVLLNVDLFCFNSTANINGYEDIVLKIQVDVFLLQRSVVGLFMNRNLYWIISMINQIINKSVWMHKSGKAAANVLIIEIW